MENEQGTELPSAMGKPAIRALTDAGYTKLAQFAKVKEKDLLQLHGVGKKATTILRESMAEKGLKFAE